jgi:hypothetical protein
MGGECMLEDLMDFISKDMQAYMSENGLTFTDSEKATLIYNSQLPVKERYNRLEKLMAKTEDEKLKKQISREIEIFDEDISAFKKNVGGYVYAVKSYEYPDDPYTVGFFASAKLAYDYAVGKSYKFDIEKCRINGFSGVSDDGTMLAEKCVEVKKGKIYTNPYLFKDEKDVVDGDFLLPEDYEKCIDENETEFAGYPVATAGYNDKGEFMHFYSSEVERLDADKLEDCFSPELFKNAFIYMPNPFERGDIVRTIVDRSAHGFISESREAVEKFHERVRQGLYVDYIDASMTVDFIGDDGTICHSHINPAYLEKFEPDKADEDYELLTAGRALLKGDGTLDWFLDCYERLKNKRQSKGNT